MTKTRTEALLIEIAQILAGEENFFTRHELVESIKNNQHYYERVDKENCKQFVLYLHELLCTIVTTIATLGMIRWSADPGPVNGKNDTVTQPKPLLPKEVYAYQLAESAALEAIERLVEAGKLSRRGEDGGAVYIATRELWEVNT